jgi:hypothetical protein
MAEEDALKEMVKARSEASDRIVSSRAPRRLIVAGPGTGKTYTFRRALQAAGGRGLALTFIRNLVHDLEGELSELADVFTFHGFAKYLLHRTAVEGLSSNLNFYPALPLLIAEDMALRGRGGITREVLDGRFHDLDSADGVILEALTSSTVYFVTWRRTPLTCPPTRSLSSTSIKTSAGLRPHLSPCSPAQARYSSRATTIKRFIRSNMPPLFISASSRLTGPTIGLSCRSAPGARRSSSMRCST